MAAPKMNSKAKGRSPMRVPSAIPIGSSRWAPFWSRHGITLLCLRLFMVSSIEKWSRDRAHCDYRSEHRLWGFRGTVLYY
jgi:hypothetical protein